MTVLSLSRDPRTQFGRTVTDLLDDDLSAALVYAEISARFFTEAERRFPERVVNVGIREQLLVNVGAGFALTGMRPIVHTFGTFLVERAFEQVKLGFAHQGVGGVLVGVGGSFDASSAGRTHQAPGDVALDGHAARGRHPRARHLGRDRRGAAPGGRRRGAALRPGRRADQHRVVRRRRPPRRTTRGRAPPWSPSGRSSTRCWPPPPTATSRCSTPTASGPSTGHPAQRDAPHRTWCSWSRGWPAPRPAASPRPCSTVPTACSRWARGGPSSVTTARPPSTSAPTASTPRASAGRWTRSWLRDPGRPSLG